MVKRRVILTLSVAAALAVAATPASAAPRPSGSTAKRVIVSQPIVVIDGSTTSLVAALGDQLLLMIRGLRSTWSETGTGYELYGSTDGPDGIDGVGVKNGGINTPAPAYTRVVEP